MQDGVLYQHILNSLSEGVLTLDRDWNVMCFNRAAERLLGLTSEEVVGRPFRDVFMSTTCEFRPLVQRAMETGESILEAGVVIMNRRQELVPVSVNVAPIMDEAGARDGVVATFRDVSDLELLRKELRGEYAFGDIVSRSPKIRRVLEILPDVARSDSTVLILGASGTGKEVFARAIHNLSDRRDKRFVAVNCGALPDTLLESELFGYEKGAFTDARKDKPGRFALAEGGTLFLDEIGDVSPAMQVKLLRVLQEREYEPLGATRSVKANARVLAATNRDLKLLVAEGRFRSDLYYRLNVVQIDLPPLAKRREDLPLLIEHFIRRFNAKKGRAIERVSRAALNRLMRHDFPGNVRELENVIEHAFILCRGDEIQEGCLPQYLLEDATPACYEPPAIARDSANASSRSLAPQNEKETIIAALRDAGGHRGRAATALGIDKSTLWRKMKKHGIVFSD
jgi:PAS domain S-box-containing protein